MNKTAVAAFIGLSFSMSALATDNFSISGFGSVGIGKSNNDVGYAGYTSDKLETKHDTLAGIQFDFEVNDKARFTAQLVANGRYDFEPSVEVAYLSYDLDSFTARGGKIRTPLFMYSDYLDVGFAFPMIRPSQEVYEHLIVSSFTGIDFLIPIEIGESVLQLQPYLGTSQVEERDAGWGQVDFNKTYGLAVHWYIDDLTFRTSYASTHSDYSPKGGQTLSNGAPLPKDYTTYILDDKHGQFFSLGFQYDDGNVVSILEAMQMKDDGRYIDVRSFSGFLGYRIGEFTPYVMANWSETTDNDERNSPVPGHIELSIVEQLVGNFERASYSLGSRWDIDSNIALKLDVTYVDYHGTSGGFLSNVTPNPKNLFKEDSSIVYAASLDFVF